MSTSSSKVTRSTPWNAWPRSSPLADEPGRIDAVAPAERVIAVVAGQNGPVREIIDDIDRWRQAGKKVAVARVVKIEGSGPRDPGAAMAVSEDGEVAGSVSGGCVEGAVVSEALGIIAEGGPGRMVSFGYSDDEAFAVGLTCGGTIRLFIEPLDW
jgi:hypothetical protein